MQEIVDMFFVEGDLVHTVCGMLVLFVGFVLLLDAVYIIKSAMKSAM